MIAGKKGQFFTLGQLGDLQAVFEACDEVVHRFGEDSEPAVQTVVESARALLEYAPSEKG